MGSHKNIFCKKNIIYNSVNFISFQITDLYTGTCRNDSPTLTHWRSLDVQAFVFTINYNALYVLINTRLIIRYDIKNLFYFVVFHSKYIKFSAKYSSEHKDLRYTVYSHKVPAGCLELTQVTKFYIGFNSYVYPASFHRNVNLFWYKSTSEYSLIKMLLIWEKS